MLAKDDLSRLLRYTVWANHRIMRSTATLAVEDFTRDLGGSHGGVRGTLAHMMWAELRLARALEGPAHASAHRRVAVRGTSSSCATAGR